mgnify:CR=1 FL=1
MITQKDTLKAEIKLLETFSQIQLYKELEVKKSILNTLEWM